MMSTISFALVIIQFLCIAVVFASGPLWAEAKAPFWLELAGFALGFWALVAMKPNNISIMPEVRSSAQLVRNGPYRFIRHPMYTAILVASLAVVLDSFSWYRLAVWGILLATLLVKISREESFLVQHFETYREYMTTTKKLVPFVY